MTHPATAPQPAGPDECVCPECVGCWHVSEPVCARCHGRGTVTVGSGRRLREAGPTTPQPSAWCEWCERPVLVDDSGRCERCHAALTCDTCGGEGELEVSLRSPAGSIRLVPRTEVIDCPDCPGEWEAA